jgi:hypothetical protein
LLGFTGGIFFFSPGSNCGFVGTSGFLGLKGDFCFACLATGILLSRDFAGLMIGPGRFV